MDWFFQFRIRIVAAVAGSIMLTACANHQDQLTPGDPGLPIKTIIPIEPSVADDASDSHPAFGFYEPVVFSTHSIALDMGTYDYNGDGILDILAPLLGAGICVLQNQSNPGTAAFSCSTIAPNTNQIVSVGVAKFTADDIPDLFTLDSRENLVVYQQAIDGTLTVLHSLEDVDAKVFGIDYANSTDSILDLMVGVSTTKQLGFHWFTDPYTSHSQGFRGFSSPWEYPAPRANYIQMKVVDIDSAGINSVIMIDAANRAIATYVHAIGVRPWLLDVVNAKPLYADPNLPYPGRTTRYSSSIQATMFSHNPRRFSTGDMDSDSIQDLAVLMENPGGDFFGEAKILPLALEESEFPFTWVAIYETQILDGQAGKASTFREAEFNYKGGLYFPGTTHDVAVADVNGDEIPDIVGVTEGSRGIGSYMFYFPGKGDFTFGDPVAFLIPLPGFRISVFDVDGDSFNDACILAPLGSRLLVFLNDAGTGLGEAGIVFPMGGS